MRALLLACVMTVGLVGAVKATPITATYDFTGAFTSGPYPTISGSITLSYDPATNGQITVQGYDLGALSTYVPIQAVHVGGDKTRIAFGNSCAQNTCGFGQSDKKFFEYFTVNGVGDVTSSLNFNYADGSTIYAASTNVVTREVVSSVPEPASLALLGAGLMGAGMIRRRRSA